MNKKPLDGTVPKEPTDREFLDLRDLLLEHAGIFLGDTKKPLLYARLARRLRELGLGTFGEYARRVASDPEELAGFLDRMMTNDTHFFREPHHFEYLADTFVPELVEAAAAGERPRTVRAWSAGCSTGEEAYSIAMTLVDHLPAGWTIDVLATDLSTRALEVARSATWPAARVTGIPDDYLKRFLLRGVGSREGWIRASAQLRSLVRVQRANLNDEISPPDRAFDLVFCRNVLIYFQTARRHRALARLVASLAPGGQLFVGHAENVVGVEERLLSVSPTVYARATDLASRRRRIA